MSEPAKPKSGAIEGPAGYNGGNAPTSAELKAPVKVYPASSKIGHTRGNAVEGPCDKKY